MAARLIIARHGNTFDPGDTILRVGGRTDLDLSASGLAQAKALAAHFCGDGFDVRHLRVGPLKRTRQTAAAISAELAQPVETQIEERLREIDYGPDEGRPEAEVVARIGEAALAAWEARGQVPDGWKVDVDGLRAAWRDILTEATARGGDTLAVTSNGIARFALQVANAPTDAPLKLRTGAYGVITAAGDGFDVTQWDLRPAG